MSTSDREPKGQKPARASSGFAHRLASSPSLRRIDRLWTLLRTVSRNAWNEFIHAPCGVRRTDLWRDDNAFVHLLPQVRTNTLLTPERLFTLYQCVLATAAVPGNAAELGVYKGGSAKLLAHALHAVATEKRLLLCDTFSGLPKHDAEHDTHREGDLADTSYAEVKAYLADCTNVVLHQGLFSETFTQLEEAHYSLVHVDADLYESVGECCAYFYPRLAPGGILIFDDYGFISCPGARRAVDVFFHKKPEKPIYLMTGQCMTVKINQTQIPEPRRDSGHGGR